MKTETRIQIKLSLARFRWLRYAIEHWQRTVDESDMGCDWSEAAIMCWRCGFERMTQRCHIVPSSLGGGDEPENIVALCAMCHDEAPNVPDSQAMWTWIRETRNKSFYGSFWWDRAKDAVALRLGISVTELQEKIDLAKLVDNYKKCGLHFGQASGGARMTPATLEWVVANSVM